MKLIDRFEVEGSTPRIFVGHRTYRNKSTRDVSVSATWYAEYTHDGAKFYEPLKTTNKKAALAKAWSIIHRIEKGEARVVPKNIGWNEIKTKYIEEKTDEGRSPKTLSKYSSVLDTWVDFAGQRKLRHADKTTSGDFWAFKKLMADQKLSDKTQMDRLLIIKQTAKWATNQKLLNSNPLMGIKVQEAATMPQPCFMPHQIPILLEKADDHDAPILATFTYTGMRFGEIRDLDWCNVHLDWGHHGRIFVVNGGSGRTTKSKRTRWIPIHCELRKYLDKVAHREGRVFLPRPSSTPRIGDRRIDERRFLRSLKRLCKRCRFVNPEQYKIHTFRHTFASMLARRNVSYKYALEFMGHKESKILDLYYRMFDDAAEAAIGCLDFAPPPGPLSPQSTAAA